MSLYKPTPEEAEFIARTMYRYDQVAQERAASIEDVDDVAIRRYKRDGFLIADRVFTDQEVADAKQEISDIIQGKIEGPKVQFEGKLNDLHTPEERELAVRKIHDFVDYAPALRKIAFHLGVQNVLSRIFGEEAKLLDSQGLIKPPRGGVEKPWHQDMAYGSLDYRKEIAGIWVALDEAGIDNGCMHVIPGTHVKGCIPHYAVRDWQICDSHVDVSGDVVAPLKPGGVLFFSGLLVHGTPPNLSEKRRRAVQFRYAPASAEPMTKAEYKLLFTNEMTGYEC